VQAKLENVVGLLDKADRKGGVARGAAELAIKAEAGFLATDAEGQIRRLAVAGVVAANETIRHALLLLGPGREEEAMAHLFAERFVRGSKRECFGLSCGMFWASFLVNCECFRSEETQAHQGIGADGAKFKFKD
jgi:hypothetical protein